MSAIRLITHHFFALLSLCFLYSLYFVPTLFDFKSKWNCFLSRGYFCPMEAHLFICELRIRVARRTSIDIIKMVSYIRGPAYKTLNHLKGLNLEVLKDYTPNLILWGGAAVGGIATFTEGWPLFEETFYSKIPYFGKHWIHHPDPEDVPV